VYEYLRDAREGARGMAEAQEGEEGDKAKL